MSHTPSIPEGSGGGTENALPHTLLIPEGSRGGAEKCKAGYDAGRPRNCGMACESLSKWPKDKMLSVFLAFVFRRRNANWKKDKMLSIFPALVFCAMRRYGIAVAPDRQPGMAPLLQSLH